MREIMSYEEYKHRVLKKEERLFAKYLVRPLSTRLSWLFLKIYPKITPNQVTVLGFCIGLIGVVLLFFARNSVEILVAALILSLWHVFDHVDGEIARFKDMKTPTGFFLEITFDYFIIAIIPLGISFYLYKHFIQTNVLLLGFVDCISLLFYEFVIANYYWTFLSFNTHPSNIELNLTESQVIKRFGEKSLLVNRDTIQAGKIISRIGSFLIYSGHMVLMLLILTLIDVFFKLEIILCNQKIMTLHIFLLPYLFLIPVSVSLIVSQYIILKTRLEGGGEFK